MIKSRKFLRPSIKQIVQMKVEVVRTLARRPGPICLFTLIVRDRDEFGTAENKLSQCGI